MRKDIHFFIVFLFLFFSLSAFAKDEFTAAETQQISIATPGLFDKSDAFIIDLTAIKKRHYSFPLPVGKATETTNNALEIITSKGDAVKAMFDGKVRLTRRTKKYGNVIVIRHDNGLETMYAHNAQNLVEVGQKVEAGQSIAIVGTRKGQYSCLFTLMVNGGRINPNIVIDIKNQRLRKTFLLCEKKKTHINVRPATDDELADKTLTERKLAQKEELAKPDEKAKTTEQPIAKHQKISNKNTGNQLILSDFAADEWAYPLPGSHVISPYGGRRRHAGVDIKTKPNDKILAAFSGIVTRSGPYFGYGNCIVIRHDNGFETLYSHQSKNFVKVGQAVKAGDVIGLTGRTGRATTEHLHFETHFKGRRFDPALVFNHASKTLRTHTLVYSSGRVTIALTKKRKSKH